MPAFPWPPPVATAREVVPAIQPGDRALGDVAARLVSALDACGYTDRAWYAVPGGFALVTRLEQIRETGEPIAPPHRWVPEPPRPRFSLEGILQALFSAPRGQFRVLVLAVTAAPVTSSGEAASREEAVQWLKTGASTLHPDVAAAPVPEGAACTALVYQFEKPPEAEPRFVTSGPLTARQHLEAAGLLPILGRAP